MDKGAFVIKLKEGMFDEYVLRHEMIWNDVRDILMQAGRKNYSIWSDKHYIFGYYEADNLEECNKKLNSSEVMLRWGKYIEELTDIQSLPNGTKSYSKPLEKVFELN